MTSGQCEEEREERPGERAQSREDVPRWWFYPVVLGGGFVW